MAEPFVYLRPTVEDDGTGEKALLKAALDGNLGRVKRMVKKLTKRNGDLSVIFSISTNGSSVLHLAACAGHLEVCKYLVEELGGDANAPGGGDPTLGATPFMVSAQSGDVATVRYFLDHGGDLVKADDKGRTVLHHAASIGGYEPPDLGKVMAPGDTVEARPPRVRLSRHALVPGFFLWSSSVDFCNLVIILVTEFLLSKGVPVDIDCGRGTPLFMAANNEKNKTVKILLDHHANPNIIINGATSPLMSALVYRSLKCMKLLIKAGADVNCKGSMLTPLVFATMHGGYTNFVKLLLKAGADPNIPDDLGRLPIELAAIRDCKEEVEMLFPVTSPIPNVPNWSIEGVISHAKIEEKKPIEQRHLQRRKSLLKSQADTAFKQKEYKMATKIYDLAIAHGESATLYANRSVCKLLTGDGEGALSDAFMCRMLRPDWAKACYRQGAAHMLLKEYKQACDALLDAQNLDPGNAEIEGELRKARELMKNPPGEGEH